MLGGNKKELNSDVRTAQKCARDPDRLFGGSHDLFPPPLAARNHSLPRKEHGFFLPMTTDMYKSLAHKRARMSQKKGARIDVLFFFALAE